MKFSLNFLCASIGIASKKIITLLKKVNMKNIQVNFF